MKFRNKYELHWVVLDGPIKTFGAREIASGRPVFLHLLTAEKNIAQQQSFLQKIRSLESISDANGRFPVLEVDDSVATPYVVTDILEPFTTLEDWVEEQSKEGRLAVKWQLRLKATLADQARRMGGRAAFAGSALWEPVRQMHRIARGAGSRLREQLVNLKRARPTEDRPDEGIESDPEKYALWCLATAHRLQSEGNLQAARLVAGQGLTRYQARSKEQAEQTAPEPLAETAVVPEQLEAPQGRELVWAWRQPLQAMAAALTAFRLDSRILRPAALGVAAAMMTFTTGWLGWNLYQGRQDPSGQLASHRVEVRSSQPGAVISINGEECGVSVCEVELGPGAYEAQAELAGYEASSGILKIDGESGPQEPLLLAMRPLAPVIRVSSDLTAGEVFVDGKLAGPLKDGMFELKLDALGQGSHALVVRSRNAEAAIAFETAAGKMPVVQGPVKTRNLQAAVVTGLGPKARVYSEAEVTQARMIQTSLGQIRPDGLEWSNLVAGSHELMLKGPDEQKVTFATGPNPTLAAFLKFDRNFGGLQIATGEDGVNVYLNGKKYRRVTRDGSLVVYLRPDTYKIRVEKEGFESPPEQLVAVRDGERVRLNFDLARIPRMAALRINNGLPGTEVLVDGASYGMIGLDGGLSVTDLGPGKHVVLLRKELHKPRQVEREFVAGSTVDVDGLLQNALATLRVQVDPPELTPHLTLRREGETIDRAITDETLNLAEGTYTIKASAPGYEPSATSVRLVASQLRTARLNLIPEQAENRAAVELADWEDRRGWEREGKLLVRRGGDFVMAPVDPTAGTYEFTAILKRGRQLEWIVNYVDEKNYALYQLGKNYLHRIQVIDGEKSAPLRIGHPLDPDEFVQVKIEVTADSVIHKILQNGEWAVIDRWVHTGAGFARGSFGFHVPSRNEIGLRNFSFVPEISDHRRSTGL